jgi:hypothetical protein
MGIDMADEVSVAKQRTNSCESQVILVAERADVEQRQETCGLGTKEEEMKLRLVKGS